MSLSNPLCQSPLCWLGDGWVRICPFIVDALEVALPTGVAGAQTVALKFFILVYRMRVIAIGNSIEKSTKMTTEGIRGKIRQVVI
jgi:hypothetical protein